MFSIVRTSLHTSELLYTYKGAAAQTTNSRNKETGNPQIMIIIYLYVAFEIVEASTTVIWFASQY